MLYFIRQERHLQTNKEVFDVAQLPLAELASTMGLPGTPNLKFLQKSRHDAKNLPHLLREQKAAQKTAESGEGRNSHMGKVIRLLGRKNATIMSLERSKLLDQEEDCEDEVEFLKVKRADHSLNEELTAEDLAYLKRMQKQTDRKAADFRNSDESDADSGEFVATKAKMLMKRDATDRETQRLRLKERRRKKKQKFQGGEQSADVGVELAPLDSDERFS